MNSIQRSFLAILLPKLYNTSLLFTGLYLIQRQKRGSLQRQQHQLISIGILIGLGLQITFALLLRSQKFSSWLLQNKSAIQMVNCSILLISLSWLGLNIIKSNNIYKRATAHQLHSENDEEYHELYPNSSIDNDYVQNILLPARKTSSTFNYRSSSALNLLVPVFFILYQSIEIQSFVIKRQRLLSIESGYCIAVTTGLYVITAFYSFLMFSVCKRYTSRFVQQVLSLLVIHFTGAIELSKLLNYCRRLLVTKPPVTQSLVYTIRQSQQQSTSLLSQIWNIIFDKTGTLPAANASLSVNNAAIWTGTGYSFYWLIFSVWLIYTKYKLNK